MWIKNPVYIKAGIIAAGAVICFIGVYMYDNSREISTNEKGQKVLEREEGTEGTSYEMEVQVGEKKEQIDVPVSAREYTAEELKQVFEDAGSRLEKLILKDNKSLEEVRSDLDLITEIPEEGISVYWQLDNYDVMDIQGNLIEDGLTEEGVLVKMTAVLSCGEEQAVHEFYARVYPPETDEKDSILPAIEKEIKRSDEETKTESYMVLPDQINGQEVQWEYTRNTRAYAILVMGIGVSGMILVSESQRKKESEKKFSRQLKTDYPQIVNKFNLYIRAGMTIRKAWFLIVQDYEKKGGGERKAYEEMSYTMHQIQGGTPEGEAYEEYGIRCGETMYRKFGMLLSQNLRKGSKGMTELLAREAEEAFEERKNLAKKLGEEAGTKLMIPMFMMLIIVFAMVIIPAFFSIQI